MSRLYILRDKTLKKDKIDEKFPKNAKILGIDHPNYITGNFRKGRSWTNKVYRPYVSQNSMQ